MARQPPLTRSKASPGRTYFDASVSDAAPSVLELADLACSPPFPHACAEAPGRSTGDTSVRVRHDITAPFHPHVAFAGAETFQLAIPLLSEQEVALDNPLQPNAVATITNAP